MIGLLPADAQSVHDILGHANFDLVEQARGRWVQRVIQVENPGRDMRKGLLHHGPGLGEAGGHYNVGIPAIWTEASKGQIFRP